MRTLQEHIDDLDRMVDGGAAVAKVRSQIAFIGREIAALEAEYAGLAQSHMSLQKAKANVDAELEKLKSPPGNSGMFTLSNV